MVEYAKRYILENYENKTYKELVDDLSEYQVTQDQIRYILRVNKLKKPASIFSAKDDEFIKQNYLNMSYSEIGSILGFNEHKLISRIHYLGLKKLIAPKLKILDLSDNKIINLEIFKEINFQLKYF